MKTIMQYNAVGPVLIAGELSNKIVQAIRELNSNVNVQNQGSYLRILVPLQCKLTKKAIQKHLEDSFTLPDDLELIMPSFKGKFHVSKEEAIWSFEPITKDKHES